MRVETVLGLGQWPTRKEEIHQVAWTDGSHLDE